MELFLLPYRLLPANVLNGISNMSGFPKAPLSVGGCPFCGVAADVPHESQEGCIAALHAEIGRMRGILANLRPAGLPDPVAEDESRQPAAVRLSLSKTELL
jgi:hypothetical protein